MSDDTINHDASDDTSVDPDIDVSRRRLFGKGAAVAAVAAVASVASSSKIHAANGDTMFVGTAHTATATTTLSGGTTFRVIGGASIGAASIYGLQGETDGGDFGVRGDAFAPGSTGVYGRADNNGGVGVHGAFVGTSFSGPGVRGVSNNGVGVQGEGTSFDLFAGSSGRVGLTGSAVTATAGGAVGTIARDASGTFWYCYAANQWQRLGGATVAGGFTAIAPVRVFDSRNGGFPGDGIFGPNTSRVISVKDGRDQASGDVTAADAVPAGATAVTFNVTSTGTTAGSFLAVVPGDVTETDVSTLNWSGPGVSIANASVTKLDGSRQVRIIAGGGGSFHAIVDITGYYL